MRGLATVIYNTKSGMYHPALYRESKIQDLTNDKVRFIKVTHHPKGFKNYNAALDFLNYGYNQEIRLKLGVTRHAMDKQKLIEWNGEDTPPYIQVRVWKSLPAKLPTISKHITRWRVRKAS